MALPDQQPRPIGGLSNRKLAAVLFLLVAVYGLLRSHVPGTPRSIALGQLPMAQLDGTPLPTSDVTGRPVVVNVWAPWCGPCRREMPAFQALQRAHPEVTVLGIENDPDVVPQARGLAQRLNLTYPMVLETGVIRRALGTITGLPTTLFLDRRGRVVHTAIGALEFGTMQNYLADASRP